MWRTEAAASRHLFLLGRITPGWRDWLRLQRRRVAGLHGSARSVWSAWSLVPLSDHPCLTTAPASWTHSKRFAEQAPPRLELQPPPPIHVPSCRLSSASSPLKIAADFRVAVTVESKFTSVGRALCVGMSY